LESQGFGGLDSAGLLNSFQQELSNGLQESADVVVISTRDESHLVWFAEENHSQVETGPAFHDGTAEFADSSSRVGVWCADCCLSSVHGIKDFSLVCWRQRFHPLAEAGS
jgi:hypothetical protein